mmetsp:Transcript_25521/g.37964  ORF Transcript_25521/g.37964 Transcript_25521/m.37964 type:complete len:110 (-) Transcript_25521:311-640(-)
MIAAKGTAHNFKKYVLFLPNEEIIYIGFSASEHSNHIPHTNKAVQAGTTNQSSVKAAFPHLSLSSVSQHYKCISAKPCRRHGTVNKRVPFYLLYLPPLENPIAKQLLYQ